MTARAAISATLDGEPAEVPVAELDAHLATCQACVDWRERAVELTRRSRLTRMQPVSDLTDVVLARISLPSRRRRTSFRLPWLRILLAAIASVQIGVGVAQLVTPMFGHSGHHGVEPMFGHVGRETAAFNIAIGAGLLWVASHPRRAIDQLPLLGTLVVLLGLLSAYDLGSGNVGWSRLVTHIPVLLATVVLVAMHRRRPAPIDPEPARIGDRAYGPAEPDDVRPASRIRIAGSRRDPEPPAATRHHVA